MPDAPSGGSVNVNGIRLSYWDWGGSGQTALLIHGLASTHHIWDLVAPILTRDFRVVVLDQRGHGESDKPDTGYDFATVASDLNGAIQALGLGAPVIAGHSWGGNVALEHGATFPNETKGLCLIDGGAIEVSGNFESLDEAKVQMAPPDFSGMTLDDLRARSAQRSWGFEITPEIREIVFSNFEVLEDGTIRAQLSRQNHMRVIEAFWDQRPSQIFPRVQRPVLLMPTRGGGDRSSVEWKERSEKAMTAAGTGLPVSKTVWLEDSVHDVPLQRPGLVAGVIADAYKSGFFG